MSENDSMIVVRDMRDPDREVVYDGAIGPRMAVICAHARDCGDLNTWGYEERYGSMVEEGRWHYFCGNHAARRARVST